MKTKAFFCDWKKKEHEEMLLGERPKSKENNIFRIDTNRKTAS